LFPSQRWGTGSAFGRGCLPALSQRPALSAQRMHHFQQPSECRESTMAATGAQSSFGIAARPGHKSSTCCARVSNGGTLTNNRGLFDVRHVLKRPFNCWIRYLRVLVAICDTAEALQSCRRISSSTPVVTNQRPFDCRSWEASDKVMLSSRSFVFLPPMRTLGALKCQQDLTCRCAGEEIAGGCESQPASRSCELSVVSSGLATVWRRSLRQL